MGNDCHTRPLGQRPEVLLDERPELLGCFVYPGQGHRVAVRIRFSAETELETLETFGNLRLQALQLGNVLVHARVIELPQRAEDLVKVAWIHVLGTQHASQVLCLAGELADLATHLPNGFVRQATVAAEPAIQPSAETAVVGKATGAGLVTVPVATALRLLTLTLTLALST